MNQQPRLLNSSDGRAVEGGHEMSRDYRSRYDAIKGSPRRPGPSGRSSNGALPSPQTSK